VERGRFDEAKACYVRAIELDPGRIDALNNLGVLLSRRGNPEDAEKLLQAVVQLAPGFAGARGNLANHYLRNDRLDDAVRTCIDGLVVAPHNGALHQILALAYSVLGMKTEAVAVCRAWVEAEPDNPVAGFHLAACLGEGVPARAPDTYVRRIFDSFANSFDARLAELSYKAPALVAEAVVSHAGSPSRALAVLDAGCGTGLCGPLIAPWARTLSGVDLSKGMLHKATQRKLYDELYCGELVEFLGQRLAAYDLIVSADTLCYFGALDAFAGAAFAALRGDGLVVFTVEAHADADDAPDYRLHGHGRYSHCRRYLESTLSRARLRINEMRAVVLRTEVGSPVNGWLVSARADRSV
jgi:predicted TPR repeat methyltransferase